jgi:cytoskeletal protein CcmA (bactofilin family)
VAHIGESIAIKGELSGSKDVYLDGELEGRLLDGILTVGPHGRNRANLQAPKS